MKSVMIALSFVLVSSVASAQQISAPKVPAVKPPTKTVWVLMVLENQGAKVSVGCVRRTQADALACELPPAVADRVSVAVPQELPNKGGAK